MDSDAKGIPRVNTVGGELGRHEFLGRATLKTI